MRAFAQIKAEPSFFVENTKRKETWWKKKKSQGIRGGEAKEDRLMGERRKGGLLSSLSRLFLRILVLRLRS